MADRIKSLKADHTIEATPQRARQKQAAAEEPITARMRKRQESVLLIATLGDWATPNVVAAGHFH